MTNPLMEYLDESPQPQAPQGGAGKYVGQVAALYDAKREQSPKWLLEQSIIQDMLADLPADSIILDAPVGTGRFLPYYVQKQFVILGMDISQDMLKQAAMKVDPKRARGELREGDVRATGLPDKCVDAVVNCRITRWLSPDDCQKMLREMQRICRKRIIWTARVANHPHARTINLFEAALDGWRIVKNVAGIDLNYRILCAEPTA